MKLYKFKKIDHRKMISKVFDEALRNSGLNKANLETESVRHVVSHGYRKSEQILVVGGRIYCPQLWEILGYKGYAKIPTFHYIAGYTIGLKNAVHYIDDEPDVALLTEHFHEMISKAVVPIVNAVQTPEQAVRYGTLHIEITGKTEVKFNEYYAKWATYFNLDH